MSYFEFDDARRLHMPYEDAYARTSHWRPAPYNSIWLNWKRGMYCMSTSVFVVSKIQIYLTLLRRLNP